MDKLVVELGKLGDPLLLSVVQLLWLLEVLKVQVIGVDNCLVGVSVEVMSPFSKSFHDREEFSVIDLILSFCQVESLGEESYGVSLSVRVVLGENRS